MPKLINKYIILIFASFMLVGCSNDLSNHSENVERITNASSKKKATSDVATADNSKHIDSNELVDLEFSGQQIIAVNNNVPTFSSEELKANQKAYTSFSNLDKLNRAGQANAVLSYELMPKQKRQRLNVSPTGYHNKKVLIAGKKQWLYNRCHLIGFQFSGENNNWKNLVTGTRNLNDPSMTFYENAVAKYIKKTHHKVRYQVTPIFKGNELVARGVHMQAQSLEDDEIKFNIYIFNVQPGVNIDYQTGFSTLS